MFGLLAQMDSKNVEFYDQLDEDTKKEFHPLVAMRWASSKSGDQLILLNELVNPVVFRSDYSPSVLYKLMTACSDGKKAKYTWIPKKKKDKTFNLSTQAISEYYKCSEKDARIYRKRFSLEEVLEMADDLGYDSETVKKIKAEYK